MVQSKRYRLNSAVSIATVNDTTVNISSPGGRYSLRDDSGLIIALVKAAVGTLEIDSFVENHVTEYLAETVEQAVNGLVQQQILVPAETTECDPIFSYLDHVRKRLTGSTENKGYRPFDPSEWEVRLAGTGELHAHIKRSLAELGFAVVPFESSAPASQGKKPVIVATSDRDDSRAFSAINRTAVRDGIPAFYLSVDGHLLRVGPLVVPKATACIECLCNRVGSTRQHPSEYEARIDSAKLIYCPPPSRLASHFASSALIHLLAYLAGVETEVHLSPIHEYDMLRGSIRSSNLLKIPRCPVCSVAATRPPGQIFAYAAIRGNS